MAFTDKQRKAFEAAGYTVSKSGKTVQNKNGETAGGVNENGNFFSGSKKVMDILKMKADAETKAPVKAPAKAATKAAPTTTQRPKARPEMAAKKTDAVRPEGKAAGMPAKKGPTKGEVAAAGAMSAAMNSRIARAVTTAKADLKAPAGRKPVVGKPFNPSYKGTTGPTGFMGRMETAVARAAGRGAGARRIGPGGAGMKSAMDKAKDPLMLMAKGGMVKKKK